MCDIRKKLLIVMLVISLLFIGTACGTKDTAKSTTNNPQQEEWAPLNPTPITYNERLYVTAMNEDKVVAIDLATGKVTSEQRVGKKPYGIAVDKDRNQLLIACALSNEVWFLDLDTFDILHKVTVGRIPALIITEEAQNRAYVSNSGADTVSIIDLTSREVIGEIVTGKSPYNLEILPNNRLAVTNHDAGTLVIIDLTTLQILDTFETVPKSSGLAYDIQSDRIYSGGHGVQDDADEVFIFDLTNKEKLGVIPTSDMPAALELADPYLYILLHETKEIVAIDVKKDNTEVARFATGEYPFALTTVGEFTKVAVTNMDSNSIQIFDVKKQNEISNIAITGGPVGLAYFKK
ncbi:hypothetical protein BHU72_05400 [Desulfuribacillus stibiiarsenatis]|uniref:40-residue YVTN family beta-propeller n=1 Tax=Desulfuribacillus stibiiarsenatis TaxID=1390249 RepID=A0A1E5L4J4_9FIRM|nr:hypothetical protein [Desulfuribacillus stibiiarsenatis]OEH85047.1 hypothetical protein BHU72_05400 [Desulfuribacillus stibiiarsenatis]